MAEIEPRSSEYEVPDESVGVIVPDVGIKVEAVFEGAKGINGSSGESRIRYA